MRESVYKEIIDKLLTIEQELKLNKPIILHLRYQIEVPIYLFDCCDKLRLSNGATNIQARIDHYESLFSGMMTGYSLKKNRLVDLPKIKFTSSSPWWKKSVIITLPNGIGPFGRR